MPCVGYNKAWGIVDNINTRLFWVMRTRKRMPFLKNKAGELLKTKDEPEKQTENKAETKLANLLKTIETPKKQSENKPENKSSHFIENKGSSKNKPETKRTDSVHPAPTSLLP